MRVATCVCVCAAMGEPQYTKPTVSRRKFTLILSHNLIPHPAPDISPLLQLLLWVLQPHVSKVEGGAQPVNVVIDLNDHPIRAVVCNLALYRRTRGRVHGHSTSLNLVLCNCMKMHMTL